MYNAKETIQKVKNGLYSVYDEAFSSFTTVKNWFGEYETFWTNNALGGQKIAVIENSRFSALYCDGRSWGLTVNYIAEGCQISSKRVHKILEQEMAIKKFCARLFDARKQIRQTFCND